MKKRDRTKILPKAMGNLGYNHTNIYMKVCVTKIILRAALYVTIQPYTYLPDSKVPLKLSVVSFIFHPIVLSRLWLPLSLGKYAKHALLYP